MNKKPKILITGGLGFIFSYVTEYFVNKGWEVVVIDNESEGSHPEIINGSFTYYKMDVCDSSVIDIVKKEGPEYVIHAAAISDVDYSINNPYNVLKKNIMANLNIFEACHKLRSLKKFVYVSTDEVYGECDHRKKEDEISFPKNPYSGSKAVGSLLRMLYDNTYQELRDKTAETRFCNVFGPRQDKRKIMPLIKHAIETGVPMPVHNSGAGYREYIYVKNIPSLIELIILRGNRTYNITTNNGMSVVDLIKHIEKITGKKVPTYSHTRPGMDLKYQMDASRVKEELGWNPSYSFDQGLKEYFLL